MSMSVSATAAIRLVSFSLLVMGLGCLLLSAWIIILCGAVLSSVLSIIRSTRMLITMIVMMMPVMIARYVRYSVSHSVCSFVVRSCSVSAVAHAVAPAVLHASVTSTHVISVIALNPDLPIILVMLGLLISFVISSYPAASVSCALAHLHGIPFSLHGHLSSVGGWVRSSALSMSSIRL